MALHIQRYTIHEAPGRIPATEVVEHWSNGCSVIVATCKGPKQGDNAALIRDAFSEREQKAFDAATV